MSDFTGKVVTGAITALATLIVCLINNYFTSKRHMEDMRENERRRTEDINNSHSKEMASLKAELTASVEGLINSQTELTHAIDIIKLQIDNLRNDVNKHNQVIEQTYALERKTDVLEEKINVANNRIKDLEDLENEAKTRHG
jgi:vacuolar-type H+-ATPase subunit I/STV1